MNRKRAIVVGLLSVLGMVLLSVCWRSEIIGFCKHESRYRGKYTNSWRSDLSQYVLIDFGDNVYLPLALYRPTPWQRLKSEAGMDATGIPFAIPPNDLPLLQGDPDALPVLLELQKDNDANIRALADFGVKEIESQQAKAQMNGRD